MTIVTRTRTVHAVAQAAQYLYGVNEKNQTVAVPMADARNSFNVRSYGAVGDNTTDNTTTIQAAITAAEAVNGVVYLPAGDYRVSGLTISANIILRGEGMLTTTIRMIGASNANVITVAVGVGLGLVIEDIGLDGVSSANTSGHGIHFPVDAVSSYGHAATIRNVYINLCAGDCIRVDGNRNAGHMYNVFLARGDNSMRMEGSSDWRVFGGGIYDAEAHCLLVVTGADNVFVGTSFYLATNASCVKLDGDSSSPTKLIGCTINGNQMDGLEIVGPTGTARHIAHVVIGCWFETNGLATNDTYSDIVLQDVQGVVLMGNSFRYPGTVNKPKYTVEFGSNTATCEWVGNSVSTSPTPYATALTNEPTKLGASLVNVTASETMTTSGILATSGTANLDVRVGDTLVRAMRGMYVASGVNYLDVSPSVTGDPVQIAANGSDTDIDLRLVTKGAGVLRFGTRTASGDAAITGYIEVKDNGGTVRRLAVIG